MVRSSPEFVGGGSDVDGATVVSLAGWDVGLDSIEEGDDVAGSLVAEEDDADVCS